MDVMEKQFKRMVLAYLHDPPHKALDLRKHEEFALSFINKVWIDHDNGHENLNTWAEGERKYSYDLASNQWDKTPDHAASAADRVILPNKSAKAGGVFEGEIKHPLGAGTRILNTCTVAKAEEDLENSFGGIKAKSWKDLFFLLWRRWREETAAINPDLVYYPADTRIPDHSIWLHMDLTAAFEACRKSNLGKLEPAFLLFQLGPVQEFIAAARSTRDLWSGSYLISWLSSHALKAISDEIGPSSIIFPALRGLGIFDAVNREIFENVSYKDKDDFMSLWDRLYGKNVEPVLNPTVPNRFLALVPANRAEELAKKAENAVRQELEKIGKHCFSQLEKLAGKNISNFAPRWKKQLELLPQITWQTLNFQKDIEEALKTLKNIDPEQADRLQQFKDLAEIKIDESHRDGRNYRKCERCNEFPDSCNHSDKKWQIGRPEFAWSANFALVSLLLAARRNTREFDAFLTDPNQEGAPKDALTGKEEMIGDKELWKKLRSENGIFKNNEGPYGAINIIKRLWCSPAPESYLANALGVDLSKFRQNVRFKSTQELAGDDNYFAILAMDGDKMGEWISGAKTPFFMGQLKKNTREYFEKLKIPTELRRLVSPGYHLQFSEALSNFANKIAGSIVEKHGGSLIYAGGDDVMAALPAKNALKCAEELRNAFRGGDNGWFKNQIMVPGNKADVSCGITLAHCKYPLQRAVEEARRAEKRAKNQYCRGAFAVSLLKRGGEIIHWGAKWDDNALPLFFRYCELRQASNDAEALVSGRFPYALAALLAPYQLEKYHDEKNDFAPGFEPRKVIECELDVVMERQVNKSVRAELKDLCIEYLDKINNKEKEKDKEKCRWDDFAKLFLTAAFIDRKRGGE